MDIQQNLASLPEDPSAKIAKVHELIESVFQQNDFAAARDLIKAIVNIDLPILQVKELISHYATKIVKLNNQQIIDLAPYFLDVLSSRGSNFDEEDLQVREELADSYRAKGDYKQSARVLAAVNLDSASRNLTPEHKANIYLKIAEQYLEDHDEINAEVFNAKATNIVYNCSDMSFRLRNRVCHARILDNKGEFIQAARAYYSLSLETNLGVVESDLLNLLQFAVTSCILGKAGPQRSMLLATIYKDERSQNLPNHDMLQRMFMQRIVRKQDLERFTPLLQDYQKYKLASGLSVLENAVLEHNIVAISKIYNNITFTELAEILEVKAMSAELIIANMVQEGRVNAALDQERGLVEFESVNEGLTAWEGQAEVLCQKIEKLVEHLSN